MHIISVKSLDGSKIYNVPTVDIVVKSKKQTIIPLITEYNMSCNIKLDEVIGGLNVNTDILPTTFSFADVEKVKDEGVKFYFLNNEEYHFDLNTDLKAFLYLDKTDNRQLILMDFEKPLNAAIVDCEDISHAVKLMAASAYVSKAPTKGDWNGYASAQDPALEQVRQFGMKYQMSGTAAQKYLGISIDISGLKRKSIFGGDRLVPERSFAQAEELYKMVNFAFDSKQAKQTRFINAINSCIQSYGYDLVIQALGKVTADDKLQIDFSSCEKKVSCITQKLTEIITTIKLEGNLNSK